MTPDGQFRPEEGAKPLFPAHGHNERPPAGLAARGRVPTAGKPLPLPCPSVCGGGTVAVPAPHGGGRRRAGTARCDTPAWRSRLREECLDFLGGFGEK